MSIQTIDEISLENKRVFIRVDFNVPIAEGKVLDDTRILESLPTIQYAIKKKAIVILASHLGRPKGEKNPELSLAPVAERLMELLKIEEVIFSEHCAGNGITKLSKEMTPGQVMLLENLRFDKGEEKNDENFAQQLASLCDVYINDAFGTAHRAHASTVGMVAFVKEKGIGFLMKKELEFLSKVVGKRAHPFIAILGGAKVSDKIGVINNLLGLVDGLMIGGAMATTFLKANGIGIGNSKVEEDKLFIAKKILKRAQSKEVPIYLPLDHRIVKKLDSREAVVVTKTAEIPAGWLAIDIGPKTEELFAKKLERAKTVFWNGPLGVYEIENFAQGTYSLAKAIASLASTSPKTITIIGGGDSAAAVRKAGLENKVSHISTGGGASLEFIEGKKLPGLAALEN